MTDFLSLTVLVALSASFFLSLGVKWGLIEWLQLHAPNDFLNRVFSCKFCCSWWVSVFISLFLWLILQENLILAIPVCSTVIAKHLW